jgi:DNA-binding CsgD family transcriptional regulator
VDSRSAAFERTRCRAISERRNSVSIAVDSRLPLRSATDRQPLRQREAPRADAAARRSLLRRQARPGTYPLALTAREREVADWLSLGKSNAEICSILAANTRTIEKHVEHILQKLGVENRVGAAIRLASEPQLLTAPEPER